MTHDEKCHIDGDTTIHDELVYIGQTTCGRIEIPLKCQNILNIDNQFLTLQMMDP